LALNGRLAIFLAWVIPGSLLMLSVGALIRQQVTPAMLDEPPLPHRYRVADDLHQPLAAVIAAAEHTTPPSPQPAAGAGLSGLEPPMTAASDAPGLDGIDERRCGRFGCLEVAAWIVTDPQGGQLAPARATWMCSSTTPSPGSRGTAASES
jgi:hypothetical protein